MGVKGNRVSIPDNLFDSHASTELTCNNVSTLWTCNKMYLRLNVIKDAQRTEQKVCPKHRGA
jgi:hypothetical protein